MLKVAADFDCEASYFHDMIKDDYFFLKASTGDLFLDWKMINQIDENNIVTYCTEFFLFLNFQKFLLNHQLELFQVGIFWL